MITKMKKQAYNPYLPSYEYVPDGEPYVFGDRLYVYGSHDKFNGDTFCVNDYVCWSASVDDLGDWRFEGIIFKSEQDPLTKGKHTVMNAPDVERGQDGRYYLFYQLAMQKVISVAVAEEPWGPFAFYGHIRHPDGMLYGQKKGDAYNFDPSVFTDDDGKIYLYTGSSTPSRLLRFMMKMGSGEVDYGICVRLEQDMLTVVEGTQKHTVPGMVMAKGTPFEGHGFFEASSMRKINGRYYFVYSSEKSHDLCYAVGSTPTGPWEYGGILVDIGDVGLNGRKERDARNFLGNTHGGMVCIHGQWYVFYHRQTNKQMCARQGCAEPVTVEADGRIKQAEITSCGLNGGSLSGRGVYEARIACNLWGKAGVFKYAKPHHTKEQNYPYFTQSGSDREADGDQYIAEMSDGAVAGFKYFDFGKDCPTKISIGYRGMGEGTVSVFTSEECREAAAVLKVAPSSVWKTAEGKLKKLDGVQALFFRYNGTGSIDFKEFNLGDEADG